MLESPNLTGTAPRVVFFIDGFNLYHSIKAAQRQLPDKQLKWLNIPALCRSYLHQIGGGAELSDLHYFTAFADHLLRKSPQRITRHKAFTISKEAYAKHQFPDQVQLPSGKCVTIPTDWKI